MKKMLIVYYSAVNGNTCRIAQQLQAATGADMEAIETLEPYTGSHQAIVDWGRREVDAGFKPAVRLLRHDLDGYDTVAVVVVYDGPGGAHLPDRAQPGGQDGGFVPDPRRLARPHAAGYEGAVQGGRLRLPDAGAV